MAVSDPGAAGAADTLMIDSSSGGAAATAADPLLPSPGPEAAAKLGSTSDLQFFAGKMRDVCSQSDDAVSRVQAVIGMAGGVADGTGAGSVGGEAYLDSCESIELLNRQLKAYLASL